MCFTGFGATGLGAALGPLDGLGNVKGGGEEGLLDFKDDAKLCWFPVGSPIGGLEPGFETFFRFPVFLRVAARA